MHNALNQYPMPISLISININQRKHLCTCTLLTLYSPSNMKYMSWHSKLFVSLTSTRHAVCLSTEHQSINTTHCSDDNAIFFVNLTSFSAKKTKPKILHMLFTKRFHCHPYCKLQIIFGHEEFNNKTKIFMKIGMTWRKQI